MPLKTPYVCNALKIATRRAGDAQILWAVCDKIVSKIERSMRGQRNVENWLDSKGYSTNLTGIKRVNAIQSYRFAWMLAMIAEYERKGE